MTIFIVKSPLIATQYLLNIDEICDNIVQYFIKSEIMEVFKFVGKC